MANLLPHWATLCHLIPRQKESSHLRLTIAREHKSSKYPTSFVLFPITKVTGQFSISLVLNLTSTEVNKAVLSHLDDLWAQRGSPNRFYAYADHDAEAWLTDFNS